PQVRKYYEAAIKNLDDLLARKPDDIWARVYRAHLNAEYTGDLADAMKTWRECGKQCPENPAPYFFLAEGYLRSGNLKECLGNISRAIALRALGN
ncbi:MAG: tetratricopeptide repeat protein, partial [Terriglobales bacterium]